MERCKLNDKFQVFLSQMSSKIGLIYRYSLLQYVIKISGINFNIFSKKRLNIRLKLSCCGHLLQCEAINCFFF